VPSSLVDERGFQKAIVRSRRGAASVPTTVTSRPSSECASPRGFAIGRGGEQELRLGAVDLRHAAETAQDVADV